MDLRKYILKNTIKVQIVPRSCRTELVEENGFMKLYLRSAPEKNKANKELIAFVKIGLGGLPVTDWWHVRFAHRPA